MTLNKKLKARGVTFEIAYGKIVAWFEGCRLAETHVNVRLRFNWLNFLQGCIDLLGFWDKESDKIRFLIDSNGVNYFSVKDIQDEGLVDDVDSWDNIHEFLAHWLYKKAQKEGFTMNEKIANSLVMYLDEKFIITEDERQGMMTNWHEGLGLNMPFFTYWG